MKKIAYIAFILMLPLPALGQYVTITGTVQDPNGCPYTNGTGVAVLVPTNTSYFYNQTNPARTPVVIAKLDGFGHFSIQLNETDLLTPTSPAAQWQFSFSSSPVVSPVNTGPISFTMSPMPLTTSQDISATIASQSAAFPGGCTGGQGPPTPFATNIGGTGTTTPCSSAGSLFFYTGIIFSCDPDSTTNGLGSLFSLIGTFNTVNTVGSGAGTWTPTEGTGIPNPSAGKDTLYVSSINHSLTCLSGSGAQCPWYMPVLNYIRFASEFVGADCGAKIMAADASLGTEKGEIWVSAACGTTISTTVAPTNGHVIRFIDSATYSVTVNPGFDLSVSGTGIVSDWSGFNSNASNPPKLQAGANNVVLVKSVNTFNGSTGSLTYGNVLTGVALDGNKANFTSTKGINFVASADFVIRDVGVFNSSGTEQVTLSCPIQGRLEHFDVENGGGAGVHIEDNGSGCGSGNLRYEQGLLTGNGGDGIIFEGGGAGQLFTNLNFQSNTGAAMRIRNETSSGLSPQGWTIDTFTLEANCDATAQFVVAGVSGAPVLSGVVSHLISNGLNEGCSPSPTGVSLDWAQDINFISSFQFNSTNSFNLTANATNINILWPRSTDTNFYKAASSLAACELNSGAVFQIGCPTSLLSVAMSGAITLGSGTTFDGSAETGSNAFKVPVKAGAVATASGAIAFDSTAGNFVAGKAGSQVTVCTTAGEAGCGGSGGVSTNFWNSPWGGGSNVTFPTANTTKLFAVNITTSLVGAKHLYYHISTADNTANVYDLGFYNASGTLICDIGATAGTTFAPSTGDKSIAIGGGSGCTTTAGQRYYIALTDTVQTATITGQTSIWSPACGVAPATGSTTTGGALNGTVTFSADAASSCTVPNIGLVP